MKQPDVTSQSVSIDADDGCTVAAAEVADDGEAVHLQFRIAAGHLPTQVRHRLIETVFELPAFAEDRNVKAALPLGDSELLEAMRGHCKELHTRAAGASCLLDGESMPSN